MALSDGSAERRSGRVVTCRQRGPHDRVRAPPRPPGSGPERRRRRAGQRAFAWQLPGQHLVRAIDLEPVGPLRRGAESQAGFNIEGYRLAQQAPGGELQRTCLALQPFGASREAVDFGQPAAVSAVSASAAAWSMRDGLTPGADPVTGGSTIQWSTSDGSWRDSSRASWM